MEIKRTNQQRKAIEVFCRELAEKLNDAGYDFNDGRIIRLPVSFTQENVKEHIFKVVMNNLYPEITSTAQLNTKQVNEVYNGVNMIISENWHIYVDPPSNEPPMLDAQEP